MVPPSLCHGRTPALCTFFSKTKHIIEKIVLLVFPTIPMAITWALNMVVKQQQAREDELTEKTQLPNYEEEAVEVYRGAARLTEENLTKHLQLTEGFVSLTEERLVRHNQVQGHDAINNSPYTRHLDSILRFKTGTQEKKICTEVDFELTPLKKGERRSKKRSSFTL